MTDKKLFIKLIIRNINIRCENDIYCERNTTE